jgi:hypothetical protein
MKPSQGIRFEKDRSGLQNIPVNWPDESLDPTSSGSTMTKTTPQECVGNSAISAKHAERGNDARRVTWSRDMENKMKKHRFIRRMQKAACE